MKDNILNYLKSSTSPKNIFTIFIVFENDNYKYSQENILKSLSELEEEGLITSFLDEGESGRLFFEAVKKS